MDARKEWLAERQKGIGGSDAGKIMAGEWFPLWEEKTGRREPEDLSWAIPVQVGVCTEDFNRRYFAHITGLKVSDGAEHIIHQKHQFMRGNTDGQVSDGGILECKHVNAWTKEEDLLARYWPQMQHYLAVTGAAHCYLSAFIGTQKHEWWKIEADTEYQAEMIEREAEFWAYVEADMPPPDQPAASGPAIPATVEYDMQGNNAWADGAADWIEHKTAAKKFKDAEKTLKDVMPDDGVRAYGHGVEIKRAKNGSLRIGVQKDG